MPLVAALVLVLVAAMVLGVGMTRRSFPQVDGELNLPGLSAPVDVLRDERGVTQIYADTAEDLFQAQGFTAAQDRFFQMDLRRHVTSGRLAELVGEPGVETDRVIRTMGWRQVAERELPQLDADTRRYLSAYTAGVNAYLEQNPSPSQVSLEYVVLGQSVPDYRIEPWEDADSVAWLKAMAWDLRGNYSDELARARLVGELSRQQRDALYPPYPHEVNAPILSEDEWEPEPVDPPESVDRRGGERLDPDPVPDQGGGGGSSDPAELAGAQESYLSTVEALAAVPNLLGEGSGIGSNSWVVSGEHTESGLPLLANDPHLGVSQPGIWMQTGLHCRQVTEDCPFDVSGFTFAGFPGVIIGHNQDVAWGLTNLDPDVTDFYLEEIVDGKARRGSSWEPIQQRTEVIEVAGGDDVVITVRETRHGPVLSDVVEGAAAAGEVAPINGVETLATYDVSMAWTALEPNRTADAVFALNTASDWETFREAARAFAVPSQNLVYADTEGNIGYQAPGQVPIRESSTNGAPPGFLPAQGWMSAYDWQGWVPFEEMPHALNPEDGIIVTANQAVMQGSVPFLTTEYDKGYRSQRIADLLDEHIAEGPLTTDTMRQIQGDTYNPFADELIEALLEVELDGGSFYTEPQQMLADWDRTAPVERGEQSAAAMYYYAVWAHLLDLTFGDELPNDLAPDGNSRWMLIVSELLDRPDDEWWDDQTTAGVVENRDEILKQAMINARLDLTRRIGKDPSDWNWGELHRVPMRHEVLGDDELPGIIRWAFNDGPYPAPGGSSLVNAFNWDAGAGSYRITSAPSMRMVVDLGDLDGSTWVNQAGNSGHAFHPNYGDQNAAWLANETFPWPFSEEAVRESSVHELRLLP